MLDQWNGQIGVIRIVRQPDSCTNSLSADFIHLLLVDVQTIQSQYQIRVLLESNLTEWQGRVRHGYPGCQQLECIDNRRINRGIRE
ncbi:hypothetical protein D1872_239010 [compost metagenome]